ncbi:MAG: hypothetical protein H6953_05375 [Chromatiaceae bacterium]|nr:hypothetical protein [Gammaproteobacteria bacterium]MCP5304854.1 hypothetical protein [Chromatiaceae bacterium]MCP5314813.1 hypothetical protein [Chromatiaceae bacterium]
MVDQGIDLDEALRRAADQHGINPLHGRPPRADLLRGISEYRELFRPQQTEQLRRMRLAAREAMHRLKPFEPRLFGSLVHGDGPLDRVRILLSADTPEQVILHLHELHLPWREAEVTMHYSGGRRLAQPAVRFLAGEASIELVIIDRRSRSDPPRDPVDGGPLETLTADQLDALIGIEGN